jgi:hypothetical protein
MSRKRFTPEQFIGHPSGAEALASFTMTVAPNYVLWS